MTDWVQITVDVPRVGGDVLSGDLWAVGVGGIEERAASDDATDELVRLVIGMEVVALDDALAVIAGHGFEPDVREVTADEGLDGWRDFAVPHVVGRVALVPAWWDGPVDVGTSAETIEIRLDAARSFGHGGHVTTRLALEAIQTLDVAGCCVLDVGCGSGVLSVAAARLGARRVVGVDVAPDAVAAASDNVVRNDVAEIVEVRTGSVEEVAADHVVIDVVVANIEAPVLIDLAPQILRLLRPGDRVVLSGLLAAQADRVRGAYDALGVERRLDEGEWSAFVLSCE